MTFSLAQGSMRAFLKAFTRLLPSWPPAESYQTFPALDRINY